MKLFILFASALFFCFATSPAEAHFLSVDGNIGTTLHIDPDDAPIANQTATFYFDIADKTGEFNIAHCNCVASISEGGHQLFSQQIGQDGFSDASFSYTFPQIDVYHVQLKGTPNPVNSFQPFTIGWDIRVDQSAGTSTVSAGSTVRNQAIGGALFALLLGLTIAFFLRKPRSK